MSRELRKQDHINHALQTGQSGRHGLDQVQFVHQSLAGIGEQEIDMKVDWADRRWEAPFYINAMTGGGGQKTKEINGALAKAAGAAGIPVAVGSQMAAVKDPGQADTFAVVRRENPDGIVFGNIGMDAGVEEALRAVEMIEADALQIHLNPVQEMIMPEGDRDFTGVLERLTTICRNVDVPVIVKEVGFGISMETAALLKEAGVNAVDAGGRGGTNFAEIENLRRERPVSFLNEWGIPTSVSIVEAASQSFSLVTAAGGIRSSLDAAKSYALGAGACGMAGHMLKLVTEQGWEAAAEELGEMKKELRTIMTLLGVRNMNEWKNTKILITGETAEWLKLRGFSVEGFAQR
ncbi:type 2 isopentenyl-diphosphate Delta-isomerase [Alkalicoccus urumqiensis]|uniref:Isopentenyl-diphosphate delta-isomerase n=1 Tax=Alkalicoccus urumqiensis TaxID=1548213 RepID=A0A2P6MKI2_ALKUR|nr:type 2 isopentenyl-diphosphate Delta-isomerase [Alkalicoccus urumqiensis]PRO66797.1 type 2 isopentenyl-diphosphate Delta-isomerase [Alkalicoccus urumqiensis]